MLGDDGAASAPQMSNAEPVPPPPASRARRAGMPRWPMFLLAAPAGVATWSGWVGLGTMAGFGMVTPLPGIADGWQINSAITLPIGVEAYGAYALGAWLSGRRMSAGTRRFAAVSAVGSLLLGMFGQITYHLLQTQGWKDHAPAAVVVFVSALPVLVLGLGAALLHMISRDAEAAALADETARTDTTDAPPVPASVRTDTPRTESAPAARTGDSGVMRPRTATGSGTRADAPDGARSGTARERSVPVDRDAVVASLAAELQASEARGQTWRPDYEALQARTGRRRSWCEKAVRDARRSVQPPAEPTAPEPRTDDSETDEARTDDARTDDARTDEAGTDTARTDGADADPVGDLAAVAGAGS